MAAFCNNNSHCDLCAGRMGEYAMNPTDVIAALPEVTKPIIR